MFLARLVHPAEPAAAAARPAARDEKKALRRFGPAVARGSDHPHAVRILARAWVDVIWACWTTHTPYDPDRHGALQRILNQDQSTAA